MFLRRSKRDSAEAAAVPEMPVIGGDSDLNQLFSSDVVVLFKHSRACPVSWMAHAHVTRFRAKNPHVPVHLVPVIEQRAASLKIAELTRVRHESPQIILLRNGQVSSVASHEDITEDHLTSVLAGN